jgi:hypothetical protein
LLAWGADAESREEIDSQLCELPSHPRVEGVRRYLQARWTGDVEVDAFEEKEPPWPFHDPDPAVVVRKLDEMGEPGRRRHLDAMPTLLAHEADRARSLAVEVLRKRGETAHLVAAVAQLDDPRVGAGESVAKLLSGIDLDRVEDAARCILHMNDPSAGQLAWAIDQAGPVFPPEEEREKLQELLKDFPRQAVRVRRALARLLGRWWPEEEPRWLQAIRDDDDPVVQAAIPSALAKGGFSVPSHLAERLLSSPVPEGRAAVTGFLAAQACVVDLEQAAGDPDSRVRIAAAPGLVRFAPGSPALAALQRDPHPLVRAAALTEDRAAELVANPEGETSWHVLAEAARTRKVPLWRLEPQPPWQPPERPSVVQEPFTLRPGAPPHARRLGPEKLLVAPMGLSGHYGLPVEGFARAVEAGVNLLFWEPNYQTLTAFSNRISPSQRRDLHFLVGTFEAGAARIRKDVERALRNLQIERISLFLIFWTRSWERVTDEVLGALERLRKEGLIAMPGLSTHSRLLAAEALAAGWDPVMVRHSAAHRGAETQVFPHVAKRGASLITFNNTCYARLLKPQGDKPAPRPADFYRYTLSFPEVTLCLSAPATLEQLDENLQALDDPHLPEDRRIALLEHGAEVYREETLFRRLVRSR